jgi:capsular exopolysaccharide synthesis family protein
MAEDDQLIRTTGVPPDRLGYYPGYPHSDLESSTSDAYSFHAYWEILRKRRSTVFTTALVVTTLVTLVVFRMKPVYRATARVEVQAETPAVQTLSELNSSAAADAPFLQTQVDLLQNNNLAWQTIQEMGLAAGSVGADNTSPAAAQSSLIRAFKKHLHVELLNESRLVEVSFESFDAALTARVANALVKNFVESNFRSKYETTRQATAWMEQQLDELKAKVEKSQQAMVDYQRENSISDIGDKENIVQERLADLSKQLTEAQTDRASKESVNDSVQRNKAEASIIANDALLAQLESKSAELNMEYAAATAQYGPNYYKVKQLHSQISQVETLMERERSRILERIGSDYRTARRREQILAEEVAQQKAAVEKLNQLLVRYTILKGEFETNQQLYNELLKRLKDATVSVSLRAANVHLADEAMVPARPIRPDKGVDIAAGLLVGLILGITLAFVRESLDRTMKTAEDVEREIAVPTLALIPMGTGSRGRYGRYFARQPQKAAGSDNLALEALNAPGSAMAESFRVLRTSILLSSGPRPPQALLVTSAHPREGKTFSSVNLALALAQRGSRVLLVDADMRKPGVLRTLGLPEDQGAGLSSCLGSGYDIEQVLQPFTPVPNLWLLPPGPIPSNPAELVSSPAMTRLVQDLRQRFEHIIIDSPPLLMVTDGILLSTLVDGVVLVVESGGTSRGALNRVRQILDRASAKTLGAVLNKLDDRADGYSTSHYRYYGYYYSHTRPASRVVEADSPGDQPPAFTPK